jgi:hypothetical protein
MVKLGHCKTSRICQVANAFQVLVLMLLCPQIDNAAPPQTISTHIASVMNLETWYQLTKIENRARFKELYIYKSISGLEIRILMEFLHLL